MKYNASASDVLLSSLDMVESASPSQVDYEAILNKLAGKDDPQSVSLRLQVLLETRSLPEAVKWIKGKEPAPEWAAKAMTAWVLSGKQNEAKQLLKWASAQEDKVIEFSCALAYSEARFKRADEQDHAVV